VKPHRACRIYCLEKSIAVTAVVLLTAALLSRPNLASAADDVPSDAVAYGTSTAVFRGTRPPAPEPAAPAATAAPRRERQLDLRFKRTFPYGSGWNNELNWEGMDSEPQIDTVVR
jgi:hypothetical protein